MKKIFRVAAIVFLLSTAYYLYRAADLYLNQAKYVYHPQKEWSATPDTVGLEYESVAFNASDDVRLSAWYVPGGSQAKGTILFCHGNARNISGDLDAFEMFHRYGYHVLAVDYRGYGKSEGSPDEMGTYRDAQAAWDWLVSDKKELPARIVICGRSLGAAIAADLASKNNPGGLILEAAFISLPDAAQNIYPYFPVKLLSRYRYDTISKMGRIHCPLLVVHSHDDELIPFRYGRQLYEAAAGKKYFTEIGGPHKGGYKPTLGKYQKEVREFLETLE